MMQLLQRVIDRIKTLRTQHDIVADEALLDTMRRLPWIFATVIPLVALGGLMTWGDRAHLSDADRRWVPLVGWLDMGMVAWLILVAVLVRLSGLHQRVSAWRSAPLLLIAASFLLFTASISIVEQWGRSSVTIYTLGCVFVGTLLLIRPGHAIALFAGFFGFIFFGMALTQADNGMLQANRLHAFAATMLGLLLSVLLWRKHTVMLLLQRELQAQREALQQSNEELQRQHAQLEFLAQRDALTGLYNRRQFTQIANMELQRARRDQTQTAFILVDVDFFKHVNDNYGHPAGDEVIKFLANLLVLGVRSTDTVARMGGEEFILLLPKTSLASALVVAEKLRRNLESSTILTERKHKLKLTASFGVTCLDDEESGSLESLYAAADVALYAAKSRGRNRVESSSVVDVPGASTDSL